MLVNILVGLATGFLTGLVTGIYTGNMVANYHRFQDTKLLALNLVRRIDFIVGQPLQATEIVTEFPYLSSELFTLGHKKAGMLVNEIAQEIRRFNGQTVESSFGTKYVAWQKTIREQLVPNARPLFRLFVR